ncbi:MAG: hypothetical protein WKF66_15180 [Pedobacter sp.]
MKAFARKVSETLREYPASFGGFVFMLVPWAIVYVSLINIKMHPAPEGIQDHRGEGLAFGVILALMIAAILLIIFVISLIVQKDKSFYVKLIAAIIFVNLFLYGLGLML